MPNEPQNPNPGQDSWEEEQFTLQDIVLSNSWAVQAILNYLEECDPNARDRIWYHYEMMKKQQVMARSARTNESPPSSESSDDDEDETNFI